MMKSVWVACMAAMFALVSWVGTAQASDDDDFVKKVAIQVSDNNPGTMTKVLNVAANLARGMAEQGNEVEIEIVAFNAGLHMLREDTSPVAERIKGFPASMPNVTFSACGNTIKGMTKKEGTPPPIMDFANHVSAGVIRLMELDAEGYFVIRP